MDVIHSRKSASVFSGRMPSQIFSREVIQLGARWQFWSSTHLCMHVRAVGEWRRGAGEGGQRGGGGEEVHLGHWVWPLTEYGLCMGRGGGGRCGACVWSARQRVKKNLF